MALTIEDAMCIINEIYEGKSLIEAIGEGRGRRSAFYKLVRDTPELQNIYAQARYFRADLSHDELKSIADDPDIEPLRARNMIDVRKWSASKMNPEVYGDRVDLNINQTVDIGAALLEAQSRVRPILDHDNTIETQRVDIVKGLLEVSSDDESDDPPKNGDATENTSDSIFD